MQYKITWLVSYVTAEYIYAGLWKYVLTVKV